MADFKNLGAWQRARELTVDTIRVSESMAGATGTLIRGQLVRAILSIPSNIAEGSSKQSDREFARYIRIALGSSTESESHLIIARDLELLNELNSERLGARLDEVQKMLMGLEKRLTSDADRKRVARSS